MKQKVMRSFPLFYLSSAIAVFLLLPPVRAWAAVACVPQSAVICVGADDEANVWINGNPINDGTDFHAVMVGMPVPCAAVPVTDMASDTNVIAVKNTNVIAGFVWASWVLDVTCTDGSHSYITNNDIVLDFYNQPTATDPAPANDGGGRPWYDPAYTGAGSWGSPVPVTCTKAIYDSPAVDPRTGSTITALSFTGCAGDNPGGPDQAPAGQILYFRQSFSFLKPVVITKTISKTVLTLGETFTYCFNYSNPEAVSRTFNLWDTIPAPTDFVGCDHSCTTQTYGSDVVVNWSITVPANGSGSVCAWVAANRYP